jgi:hypothetical protein
MAAVPCCLFAVISRRVLALWQGLHRGLHFASSANRRASRHDQTRWLVFVALSLWSTSRSIHDWQSTHGPLASSHSRLSVADLSRWKARCFALSTYGIVGIFYHGSCPYKIVLDSQKQ